MRLLQCVTHSLRLPAQLVRSAVRSAGAEQPAARQPGRDADREPASPASTSAAAGTVALEERVRAHLGVMERRLEATLQHISHELATEVGREQNHLIFMQDQARNVAV